MPGVQRTVGPSSSQWDFHTWDRCGESQGARNFADRNAAAFWLMQFKSDAIAMADLRALAGNSNDAGVALGRSRDDQVLESLSWLLVRGVLHVHSVSAPATAFPSGQRNLASVEQVRPTARPTNTSQRASVRPQSSSATQKVLDEADTFSPAMDAARTAAVLQQAAAEGVPFCEECAKAAAARQAEGAPA